MVSDVVTVVVIVLGKLYEAGLEEQFRRDDVYHGGGLHERTFCGAVVQYGGVPGDVRVVRGYCLQIVPAADPLRYFTYGV